MGSPRHPFIIPPEHMFLPQRRCQGRGEMRGRAGRGTGGWQRRGGSQVGKGAMGGRTVHRAQSSWAWLVVRGLGGCWGVQTGKAGCWCKGCQQGKGSTVCLGGAREAQGKALGVQGNRGGGGGAELTEHRLGGLQATGCLRGAGWSEEQEDVGCSGGVEGSAGGSTGVGGAERRVQGDCGWGCKGAQLGYRGTMAGVRCRGGAGAPWLAEGRAGCHG